MSIVFYICELPIYTYIYETNRKRIENCYLRKISIGFIVTIPTKFWFHYLEFTTIESNTIYSYK